VQKFFRCSEKEITHLLIAVRHEYHGEILDLILFITGYTFHDFDMTKELVYLLFGLAVENNTRHDPGLGSYWTTDLKTRLGLC
jgi:hypothetical protein